MSAVAGQLDHFIKDIDIKRKERKAVRAHLVEVCFRPASAKQLYNKCTLVTDTFDIPVS